MDDAFWDDMVKRFSRGLFMGCATLILIWSQYHFEYPAWNIALLMVVFSMIRGMSKIASTGLTFLFILVIVPPSLAREFVAWINTFAD